jgi:hypothetical protein
MILAEHGAARVGGVVDQDRLGAAVNQRLHVRQVALPLLLRLSRAKHAGAPSVQGPCHTVFQVKLAIQRVRYSMQFVRNPALQSTVLKSAAPKQLSTSFSGMEEVCCPTDSANPAYQQIVRLHAHALRLRQRLVKRKPGEGNQNIVACINEHYAWVSSQHLLHMSHNRDARGDELIFLQSYRSHIKLLRPFPFAE